MKSKVKAGALSVCGGALLVFLGLFGGVFSLGGPFELPVSPVLFWSVLLSCVLTALVFSLSSRRLRWLLLGVICLWLALVIWLRWDTFFLGAQVVFHKISLGYHQEIAEILYFELSAVPEGEALSRCVNCFFAGCIPLLSLWMGLWLLRPRAMWPAVAAACALPGLGLFVFREPGALPLAATVLFLALAVLSRRGYRESGALGGGRVLAALVPTLLVMVLIGAVFPREGYTRPVWVETLRREVKSAAKSWSLNGGDAPSTPGVYTFSRFGAPRFDGHTVLTVQSDTPHERLLLRGWSSAVYTQYGWQPLSDEALSQLPDFSQGDRPWSYPAHAILDSGSQAEKHTVRITDVDSNTEYYYTPYFPSSMYTGAVFHADSYITRVERHFSYSFDFFPSPETTTGAQVGWDGGRHYMEPAYQAFVYQHYLDVPYELLSDEALEVIRAAGEAARTQTEGHSWGDKRGMLLATGQAVADYLASFTHYDIETPAPPLGEDFVSWFLTESHRGYCAHYATVATLILREMGIPARFVGGYAANLPGGAEPVAVPDENAHAWVEVYVDGFGWQPVDVTPSSGLGAFGEPAQESQAPSTAPSETPEPSDTPDDDTPSAPPSAAPSEAPQGTQDTQTARGGVPAWVPAVLLGALGILAAVGGVWLQRRLRLERRRRQCGQEDPNAAVLCMYRYLKAVERHLGRPVPHAALDLAQKAAFSQHILTPQERQSMEAYARQAGEAVGRASLWRRLPARWVWALG